jgi:hypothetical protein
MKISRRAAPWVAAAGALLPGLCMAADMDGSTLSVLWGVPFAGILLSIALMPLLAPIFWHHHFGKVAAAWGLAFLLPFAVTFGPGVAGVSLVHALLAEYIPFVILLTALFTVAGGIYIRGNLHGSPGLNTAILAIGAVLASFMGTTGASMLLIRPLIRANDNRKHVAHVVVFFIFIVSNAGGSLTPLGDPPLFLGFLKGVDFFWTVRHIFPETLFLIGALLVLFYALDSWYYHRREEVLRTDPTPDSRAIGFDGKVNFALLGGWWGWCCSAASGSRPWCSTLRAPRWACPASCAMWAWSSSRCVAVAHAQAGACRQPVRLGAHAGSGQAVCGHLPDHHPRHRHAQGGRQRPVWRHRGAVTRPDGSPDPAMYFWATGRCSARSSTTRPPTWCSSTPPGATRPC